MAFNELVKDIERVREYMRRFFAFGFERRGEFEQGSARSYDNERRRIESYLAPYMSFRSERDGKRAFITIDSRAIATSPLHRAFKAKSFTRRDIMFHFLVMDLLVGGAELPLADIMEEIDARAAGNGLETPLDESTVRKKLREYERLGLIERRRDGRADLYRRTDTRVDLESWREAIELFSEEDPLGVIGSFVADRCEARTPLISFKHRYMLHALDSQVVCDLLCAIGDQRSVTLHLRRSSTRDRRCVVCPCHLMISTQSGRRYLLAHYYRQRRPQFYRVDNIRSVEVGPPEKKFASLAARARDLASHTWGVSISDDRETLHHIEMIVRVGADEDHIRARLVRERRCGTVASAGDGLMRFSADVSDAMELMPWLRTFIGRIERLECTDAEVIRVFTDDLAAMSEIYGA